MLVVSQPWNHFVTISYAPFINGRPLVNPWFICKFQWNIDVKKTMVIIFQQQLLMHSNPVFWLNSYHVIASNTANNIVSVIQIGKICGCDEFWQSAHLALLRTVLEENLQLQEEPCQYSIAKHKYSGKWLLLKSLQILRCQNSVP